MVKLYKKSQTINFFSKVKFGNDDWFLSQSSFVKCNDEDLSCTIIIPPGFKE